MKHTPGPWVYHSDMHENGENNGSVIWLERRGMAHCVCKAPRYATEEQWKSNAPLIAASPEMYEALKELVHLHLCDQEGMMPVDPEDFINAVDKAAQAIAKAEGKQD